ncbi:MAG: hypothetical protein CR217_05150 [Beijerinckiaceae bacterium]|nr:MAG: hypothetical protein CR217_05150 [Beijerinckiaceae bacterium]
MGRVWLAAHAEPASYWDSVKRADPCMGAETLRCAPRRRKTATGIATGRGAARAVEYIVAAG